MIVIAGILDVVANVAVIYGLRSGDLSVVSVLIALYPGGNNPARKRGAQRADCDHPVGRACAGPRGQRTPRLLDALERTRGLNALLLQLTRNTGLLEQIDQSS
jgi:hypothetical protein